MTLQPMTDHQTRVLSMSMTNLLVRAGVQGSAFSGEQVSAVLPVEPGLYSDQTELLLSNLHPSTELTIYGPTVALSSMEVRINIVACRTSNQNVLLLHLLHCLSKCTSIYVYNTVPHL